MNIRAYRYNIRFTNLLRTSKKIFKKREGLVIEYLAGPRSFYGEAAPLPGFSKDNINDVVQRFHNIKEDLYHLFAEDPSVPSFEKWQTDHPLPPSLAFGIATIAYQIDAYRANKSLREFLFPAALTQLSVNALASLSSDHLITNVKKYQEQGFHTVKFKVGSDFSTEFKQLQKVRNQCPQLKLRVDANQAWEVNEALRNCEQLSALNIEYCEEPLKKPAPRNFEKLTQNTTLRFAIDESVVHSDMWKKLLPFTSYVIIKPMLLGTFTKIFETNRLANTHDNKTIFTTTLETELGRNVIAILASGLGSSETAHGLATGDLLAQDICIGGGSISNGAFQLDNGPNDLIPDYQNLEKVSTVIS